jgi:hypothetical protein
MNFTNAVGFVVFGITSLLLPRIVPAWFAQLAVDGSSTRALWVQFMGFVQLGIGIAQVFAQVRAWALEPRSVPATQGVGPAVPSRATAPRALQPVMLPDNVVAVDFRNLAARGQDAA